MESFVAPACRIRVVLDFACFGERAPSLVAVNDGDGILGRRRTTFGRCGVLNLQRPNLTQRISTSMLCGNPPKRSRRTSASVSMRAVSCFVVGRPFGVEFLRVLKGNQVIGIEAPRVSWRLQTLGEWGYGESQATPREVSRRDS